MNMNMQNTGRALGQTQFEKQPAIHVSLDRLQAELVELGCDIDRLRKRLECVSSLRPDSPCGLPENSKSPDAPNIQKKLETLISFVTGHQASLRDTLSCLDI